MGWVNSMGWVNPQVGLVNRCWMNINCSEAAWSRSQIPVVAVAGLHGVVGLHASSH